MKAEPPRKFRLGTSQCSSDGCGTRTTRSLESSLQSTGHSPILGPGRELGRPAQLCSPRRAWGILHLPTRPSKEGKRSVLCKCKKSLMPPQLKAACEQARWFSCKHNHPRDRGSAQRHGWTAVHRTRELHCCAHPALAPLARAGRGLWPTREDALTSSPTPRPSSAPAPRPPEPSAPSGASPPPSGWLWP